MRLRGSGSVQMKEEVSVERLVAEIWTSKRVRVLHEKVAFVEILLLSL